MPSRRGKRRSINITRRIKKSRSGRKKTSKRKETSSKLKSYLADLEKLEQTRTKALEGVDKIIQLLTETLSHSESLEQAHNDISETVERLPDFLKPPEIPHTGLSIRLQDISQTFVQEMEILKKQLDNMSPKLQESIKEAKSKAKK
ncbi:uncharacterized protein LOC141857116 [Brevipalpus obovatus]|uniref:uncharacterized protein LOC141857116 n=1 Tax=Brevipalpus obovatus TaxID=246614 RepID=UPI003D9ECC84